MLTSFTDNVTVYYVILMCPLGQADFISQNSLPVGFQLERLTTEISMTDLEGTRKAAAVFQAKLVAVCLLSHLIGPLP